MMTKQLFAVILRRGAAWQHSRKLEEQENWDDHARFMDSLTSQGFVALGGPLEGTNEALLVVRATTPEEIVTRLKADPWQADKLLRVERITPWTIRLGSI